MGINIKVIKLLMRTGKREKFYGNVLTAGRQDIGIKKEDLRKCAREMGFTLMPEAEENNYITDKSLFLLLGFDNLDSMDYNDYEYCTIVHDLNSDVPVKYHNKYDLIFDSGTTEHIFNIPKAFENYNKMLKVGGRIIHLLPVSNWADHGFYMFSPTLFYDYYSANKWEIIDALLINFYFSGKWYIYSYTPGCLDRHSNGGFNKGFCMFYFVAKKTTASTFDASVQQSLWLRHWNLTDTKSKVIYEENNKGLVKRILAKLPLQLRKTLRDKFGSLYHKIAIKIPLRFYLKLIAKY